MWHAFFFFFSVNPTHYSVRRWYASEREQNERLYMWKHREASWWNIHHSSSVDAAAIAFWHIFLRCCTTMWIFSLNFHNVSLLSGTICINGNFLCLFIHQRRIYINFQSILASSWVSVAPETVKIPAKSRKVQLERIRICRHWKIFTSFLCLAEDYSSICIKCAHE